MMMMMVMMVAMMTVLVKMMMMTIRMMINMMIHCTGDTVEVVIAAVVMMIMMMTMMTTMMITTLRAVLSKAYNKLQVMHIYIGFKFISLLKMFKPVSFSFNFAILLSPSPSSSGSQGVNEVFWGVNRCGSLQIFLSLPFILLGQEARLLRFLTWDPSLIWNTDNMPRNLRQTEIRMNKTGFNLMESKTNFNHNTCRYITN